MADLPDLTALGTAIPNGRAPRVENRAGIIAAEGAAQTAASVNQAVQRYAQTVSDFNYGRARSAVLQARAGIEKKLETDQDWRTHEEQFDKVMTAAREEAGKLITIPNVKAQFNADVDADILRGGEAVRANARRMEGEWGRGELDSVLDNNRRAALQSKDPNLRGELVSGSMDAINGAMAKGYINPEQATRARQAWSENYGRGYVEVQPSLGEQARLLRNPKGTPAEFIDPEKRANMLQAVENQMRVQVDQREAKAERGVAKMQQQIMAGVPATPQAWQDLKALVAGTSVAGEYDDLVKGEKEVQTTLRMPIADQVRLVQQKQAALDTNGGTLADAANNARLRQAVDQNIKLMQNAPLVFAEQRMDTPATPVELTGVTDKNAQPAIAAELQNRAVQLSTLSKRFGAAVPMKPLLPQEAQQFSQMLEHASPNHAAELMASMRDASGDMKVFKGVMQQVAPDNPVLTSAGLLAAQRSELTTKTHWFKPDESMLSQDVAGTIIKGETLLNPSKGEKGADGKPQSKNLYLPEGATLQQEFEDRVGDAFADRPGAADKALQTVRAYYAGRASEKGRIAADNKDIDSNIVDEAVRNVVGNVVNYNGNGKVVLPWGMAKDDFNDRIEAAAISEIKRRGLENVINPDMGVFGLTNTDQEGQYAITIGRNLKLDGRRQPITFDILPPSESDRRGYINRSGQ